MSNLPNLITIARMLLVPLAVWLLISKEFMAAFLVFVTAGLGDGVDGFLARRFEWKSELGGYLDPLADKALLVSIYIVLGIIAVIPAWLTILVVTRDVLIVGAVMLAWLMGRPFAMQPLLVSKVNTAIQIAFAGAVLLAQGLAFHSPALFDAGIIGVATLTSASGALYLRHWLSHMNGGHKPEASI